MYSTMVLSCSAKISVSVICGKAVNIFIIIPLSTRLRIKTVSNGNVSLSTSSGFSAKYFT